MVASRLRIVSSTIDPIEIGKQLGLEPTKTHLKGSLRSARHKAVWPSSLWLLNSPLSEQSDMTDHIRYFVDLLEPRARVLDDLARDCKVDLFCGYSSENGQGGFVLDPSILSRLASLRLQLFSTFIPRVNTNGTRRSPHDSPSCPGLIAPRRKPTTSETSESTPEPVPASHRVHGPNGRSGSGGPAVISALGRAYPDRQNSS